ncbi:Uncharacterised protein [Serratia ficaria]|nr:Uncharacterised protein [Serratia ficaria]CAI1803394.1 Uncharacterised protein [Serratia ficaria]CAI2519997.1 Uncharacterised protein [Serratia ficaria]CAI2791831.1 Uncharacterised protein [Serratia ficaria]
MTKLKGWVVVHPLEALFWAIVIFWVVVAAAVAMAVFL